jgi:hypothetical protein
MAEERQYVTLNNHSNYSITTDEPWQFQHINAYGKVAVINPWFNQQKGYYYVAFGKFHRKKHYLLHRFVVEQYIPNPDNLPEIDHRNHDRTDNRFENLRWVSRTMDMCNRSSVQGRKFDYFDELPEGFVSFDEYLTRNGTHHSFKPLFIKFEDDEPRFITGNSEYQFCYVKQSVNILFELWYWTVFGFTSVSLQKHAKLSSYGFIETIDECIFTSDGMPPRAVALTCLM